MHRRNTFSSSANKPYIPPNTKEHDPIPEPFNHHHRMSRDKKYCMVFAIVSGILLIILSISLLLRMPRTRKQAKREAFQDNCNLDETSTISIIATSFISENDLSFITRQVLSPNQIEWIIFKPSASAQIPFMLESLSNKKILVMSDMKNELELLKFGLKYASGEFVFFLPVFASILQPNTNLDLFQHKFRQLKCRENVAVVGSMLIHPIHLPTQQPYYGSHVDNNPNVTFNIYSMGYGVSTREDGVPVPYHQKRGRYYYSLQKGAKFSHHTICSPLAGAFLKRKLFNLKLKDYHSRELNELALCMEMNQHGHQVLFDYHDFAVIVPYRVPNVESREESKAQFIVQSEETEEEEKEIDIMYEPVPISPKYVPFNVYTNGRSKTFLKNYKKTMMDWMKAESLKMAGEQTHLNIVWDFGAGSCSGWFIETMEFVTNLEMENRAPNLRVITGREDMCKGLETFKFESMDRLISRTDISSHIDVFISHKPPTRYPRKFPYNGMVQLKGIPKVVIGRSMHESENIPSEWIEGLKLVDELWLPSNFLVDVLVKEHHVDPSKIKVVPEPVDIDFYSPYYSKFYSADEVKRVVPQLNYRPGDFHFYSVFKYEDRKGPNYLLQAYFSEFYNNPSVTLHLQTYIFMHWNGRDEAVVEAEIQHMREEFIRKNPKLKIAELPRVNIISHVVPTTVMPHLYHLMDCFVLPTRGEGFGLPFAEAMSMGLPTIGTKHGGQLQFMTEQNSYLIEVDEEKSKNQDYVVPSVTHLKQLMRQVHDHRDRAKQVGKQARKDIEKNLSHQAVNGLLVKQLKRLNK